MKINGEDVIAKVIAFKDNIFEFGKPYHIKFNDGDDCAHTLRVFNICIKDPICFEDIMNKLLDDGMYGLFRGLSQNNTVASFVMILEGLCCESFSLNIPVSICDDSEAVAAGMLSPVEIIACDKMED